MAHEGGLRWLPPGGWWERKKQLPLYPFLPVQPLHATQSPFNTTSLVMPLAIIQNLQWFRITLRREYVCTQCFICLEGTTLLFSHT